MKDMRRGFLPLLCSTLAVASMFATTLPARAQSPNPHAVSMYNLGLNAYKQGSPESAIIFFKRATDIDPNLADAQYNLGVLYQSQRRFKESASRFFEVLRIKPNDCDALFQLGVVDMGLGQYAEAKKYLSSIPPANAHFQDAQRKISECDNKIASGLSAPGGNTGSDTAANYSPPAASAPYGGASTTASIPNSASTAAPYTPSGPPSYSPPGTTYNPPINAVAAPAAPAYTPPAVSGQVQVAPPSSESASKPTPIIAGSNIRVIATNFHAPSGLTFDNHGNLYVANYESNSVDRISRDGTRTQFASGGHLKGPIGLAADDNGNIYVSNYASGTVARITPAGISTIVATGFNKPYYLTLDKSGNLFVSQQSDNSVIRIALPPSMTAKPGFGGAPAPQAVGSEPANNFNR